MFHVDDAGHGKWRGTIHGAWRWHTSIDVVDTGELLELAHKEVFHFLMRHEQTAHEDAAIGFWNSETQTDDAAFAACHENVAVVVVAVGQGREEIVFRGVEHKIEARIAAEENVELHWPFIGLLDFHVWVVFSLVFHLHLFAVGGSPIGTVFWFLIEMP